VLIVPVGLLVLCVFSGWRRLIIWQSSCLVANVDTGNVDVYFALERPQRPLALLLEVRLHPEAVNHYGERPFILEWDMPHAAALGSWRGGRVHVPLWTLFLLSIAVALYVWYRRLPVRRGHCASCGYDLRGSPGPRCPECGLPFGVEKSGDTILIPPNKGGH